MRGRGAYLRCQQPKNTRKVSFILRFDGERGGAGTAWYRWLAPSTLRWSVWNTSCLVRYYASRTSPFIKGSFPMLWVTRAHGIDMTQDKIPLVPVTTPVVGDTPMKTPKPTCRNLYAHGRNVALPVCMVPIAWRSNSLLECLCTGWVQRGILLHFAENRVPLFPLSLIGTRSVTTLTKSSMPQNWGWAAPKHMALRWYCALRQTPVSRTQPHFVC